MRDDAPEGLCPRCLLSAAAPGENAQAPGPEVDVPDIGDPADVARRLPQFEILALLGRGGMGVVYQARQRELDRVVALKILPPHDALSPDFVERFRREARSLARLSHPNIVNVFDFGAGGGLHYFVMEYVDGLNLREMLRSHRLTPAEALTVVPKICDALQYAHEEGVVHRDIKPENILIDKRGRLKIADFGLAKLLRRDAAEANLTHTGVTLGTPRYMAPELVEKPESVDHRADIYSLGVVFYEMLTGEVPMGRFEPPSAKVQVDVKLDEIVLRSLERDVERRYQHASEVREDVERVTAKPLPAAAPAPTAQLSPSLHPKVETARRMSFLRWAARWLFSTSPGPGEWRIVKFPALVMLGLVMMASGLLVLLRRNFDGAVTPSTGATIGALLAGSSIVLVLAWRVYRLWRYYRTGLTTEDAARIAWRDLPADLRHRMLFQWAGAVITLAIAAGCSVILLNDFKTTSYLSTTNCELIPHSKQYEHLVVSPRFESFTTPGRTYHLRPSATSIRLAIQPKAGSGGGAAKPMTMTVKLPEMVANYWLPGVTNEQYFDHLLDLENLSDWMHRRCGIEMNEAAQREAKQIMALLKDFRDRPASCLSEFLDRLRPLTTEFDFARWGGGGGTFSMPAVWLGFLPLLLILGPPAAFVFGLIRRQASERARARLAGLPETSRLPQIRLRDLPPDLRSTARLRMAGATLALLATSAFLAWAAANQLETTRRHYRVTLQPKAPTAYRHLAWEFSFDTSEWRGDRYDVQPAHFPTTLQLTLADGSMRELQLDLTGLAASYSPRSGGPARRVVLDLEELRNWLSSECGLDVTRPEIERQSAELASLFKRHAASAPESLEVFQPRVMALPSFTSSGWEPIASRRLAAHTLAVILLAGIVIVLWAGALIWIKAAAIRAAAGPRAESTP
jgi:serine/threonine protein kinase